MPHEPKSPPLDDGSVVLARRTALTAPADHEPVEIPDMTVLPERYEDLRLLGSGSFGEVRRVLDRKLGRVVAMKILLPNAPSNESARARFLAEIKLTANLQHPGIVAVHDFGELPDGRLWYTMLEVQGSTLHTILHDAFSGVAPRWNRRRLLDALARACETMGYAHRHGVIHRDLKPENIMIGEFGQVMIMDWGLARRFRDHADPERSTKSSMPAAPEDVSLTQGGDILGTPAYMSPEQARGEVERHGPAADVYSLGAILFHLLTGHSPYADLGPLAWHRILTGDPPKLSEVAGLDAPRELVAICERAMSPEPEDRFPDASALAAEMTAFLDGARRRERALAEIERANAAAPRMAELRGRAERLRAQAKEMLSSVKPTDCVEVKLPGWQLEDQAANLENEADLLETNWLQDIHGALTLDPELPEGHAMLADHYKQKLLGAESARREGEAARFEVLLRAHDRGKYAAILSGKGALTLATEPQGARVTLYRYGMFQRRLVPELVGELGRTPLFEVPLDKGSYLLHIHSPGRIDVSYPVLIERGECWHGCPPGSREPYAIALPKASEMDRDEVYVPAGQAWTGGDANAPDSLPRRLLWVDGFIVGKYPVTNEQYVAFLNDLVANGREEEAIAACPRGDKGMAAGAYDQLAYDRDERGLFRLKEKDPGQIWRPRGPAVLMTWYGALAYLEWLEGKTGRAGLRLLHEIEREKVTRGVDGRFFPWGNHFDPTWTCMLDSHVGEPARADIDAYPFDVSPYGLRHGGGNSRDWCSNLWTLEGPESRDGRVFIEVASRENLEYRSARGGAWTSVENHCRAAARFVARPEQRRSTLGFRVARSWASHA